MGGPHIHTLSAQEVARLSSSSSSFSSTISFSILRMKCNRSSCSAERVYSLNVSPETCLMNLAYDGYSIFHFPR